MRQTKTPFRNPKLLYFYGYAPGFNSNVDVIISLRTYFANMRFVKPPPVRKTIQLLLTLSLFSSIQLQLRPTLLHFLSSLGSVRVMARISLAIRDIIKKFEGIASAAEEIFLAFLGNIQKHHLTFLKAKSSAAENCGGIFRRRRFSL